MNSLISSSVSQFLNDIEEASKKLQQFSQDVQQKDTNIREIVVQFNQSMQEVSVEDGKSQFAELIELTLGQYKILSQNWCQLIQSYIDGKSFITQFDSSIIFVVFGNVNVGKSSIGNFISGNSEELQKYYGEEPTFYVYDYADDSQGAHPRVMTENQFKENYTEETSTIQYYTLRSGLTWVDSPGIHSINGVNEELAKKYVDYADLVLFVMSSASPAKYDEFLELKRLMDKKKPLLAIINKSDTWDTDEVNGEIVKKLVAKSASNREAQEAYVKEIFEQHEELKAYTKQLDSISLSVHLANIALKKHDSHQFESSGIPRFYKKLGESLKKNAIELKKEAPKQRINSLITDLLQGFEVNGKRISGLLVMKQELIEMIEEINLSIHSVQQLLPIIVEEIKLKSMPDIDLEISKLSQVVQSGGNSQNLSQLVTNIIVKHLNESIQKHVSAIIAQFESIKVNRMNLSFNMELQAKKETYSYRTYSVNEVERDPRGFFEHIGSLFGAKYTKIETTSSLEEKQYVIGDNAADLIEEMLLKLENELLPIVSTNLELICQNYFIKERLIVEMMLYYIEETTTKLTMEQM